MKLSEAMMLGSTLVKMRAGDWNNCALGVAAQAAGISAQGRSGPIYRKWPWLEIRVEASEFFHASHILCPILWITEIWARFDKLVVCGEMTFEQLVDYVRSIEPECGECNRFQCTCVKVEEPANFGIVNDPQEVCDALGINYDPRQWKHE
jgi:hypothetical protein